MSKHEHLTEVGTCPLCEGVIYDEDLVDTTHANYSSGRAKLGQHTGDIYKCQGCRDLILHNLLDETWQEWIYA